MSCQPYITNDVRHAQLGQWAAANAADIFDVSAIFTQVANWETVLVSSDGTHPTVAGYLLWGQKFAQL